MDEQTRTEILPCDLTEAELLARGDEAARLQDDRDRAEAARDAANKASKAAIQGIEEQQHELLRQVRNKTERRDVEVIDRRNEGAMETIRLDTSELVRSRPLTPEELQITLFRGAEEGAGA